MANIPSIVCTALILHYGFALLAITPESAHAVKDVAQFKLDYTFWMNFAAAALAAGMAILNRSWHHHNEMDAMDMGGGKIKMVLSRIVLVVICSGAILNFMQNH